MIDHRAIAVDLNNAIWARLDADDVTEASPPDEREELLYAAYASTHHWLAVGTVANHARGEHLISRVAARIGDADRALHHALRCLALVEANPKDTEDWDLAFALEATARAYAASGDHRAASATIARARQAAAAISDPEDRQIVESELEREPWFGLPRD